MNTAIQSVSDANFKDEVLNAKLPVLVVFLENISAADHDLKTIKHSAHNDLKVLHLLAAFSREPEYANKFCLVTLKLSENPETAEKYDVKDISAPLLYLFNEGEFKDSLSDLHDDSLRDVLKVHRFIIKHFSS